MTYALTIVGFAIALFAIVMIHELGHYLVARAYGFRVLEYFLGFGPRLWSFRRGEIEYGVKAIPAGGYVKIAGMNPFENDVPPGDEHRAYGARPRWQRAMVILAGPMSHFIVGGLILGAVVMIWGNPTGPWRIDDVPPTVSENTPSPAFEAGMRPDDLIVSIAGVPTSDFDALNGVVTQNIGHPIPVVVERNGRTLTFRVVPVADVIDGETKGRLGVIITEIGRQRVSAPAAIAQGFGDVGRFSVDSVSQIARVFGPQGFNRLFHVLTGASRTENDPSSVVGISRQVGTAGERGDWEVALSYFAYVVIFIGLVNLLPLPPFDGGHLAVLAIEKVRGRNVDVKKLVPVSAVVLTLLLFLTISTLVLDIVKPLPTSP
jgi:membrane-associated protease RseP (regulator of RpoE activity)